VFVGAGEISTLGLRYSSRIELGRASLWKENLNHRVESFPSPTNTREIFY